MKLARTCDSSVISSVYQSLYDFMLTPSVIMLFLCRAVKEHTATAKKVP